MGRLEKQIIAGALALVGILLSVVVFKGLQPRETSTTSTMVPGVTDYPKLGSAPAFVMEGSSESFAPADASSPRGADASSPHGADEGSAEEVVVPSPLPKQEDGPEIAGALDLSAMDTWDAKIRTHVVESGDTLDGIAQHYFGTVRASTEILKLNEGMNRKSTLQLGQEIFLPGTYTAPTVTDVKAPVMIGRTHTVVAGDSLWMLALTYYKDGLLTNRIVTANPKLVPHKDAVLRLGMVLRIPE
ncbi:MAG: LysM domain-containing protein [Planctomycetota bacterium]|nr:LysM domain-containing protein [Planctomycetota bacterium]